MLSKEVNCVRGMRKGETRFFFKSSTCSHGSLFDWLINKLKNGFDWILEWTWVAFYYLKIRGLKFKMAFKQRWFRNLFKVCFISKKSCWLNERHLFLSHLRLSEFRSALAAKEIDLKHLRRLCFSGMLWIIPIYHDECCGHITLSVTYPD